MAVGNTREISQIDHASDVLVIGGGTAGNMAAIAAAEAGAQVCMVDKTGIIRSGCAGPGNDHFLAVLEAGEPWDTPAVFIEWYRKLTNGMVDSSVVESTYTSLIKGLVQRLEGYGIPLRDPATNEYIRTGSFGQPGKYFINFDGRGLKPYLTKEAARLGAELVRYVMITDLIEDEGRVTGAVGFNIRTGEFHTFRAKTVLLTTGNACRMYENPSGLRFNTWSSPFNTGSAQAMAFSVGATLANMEFTSTTLTPRNFSAPGFNGFVGMGAYAVNALGERFMFKINEKGEQGPRWTLPWGVYWEAKDGRGPCYFDCRHLSPEALEHLTKNLLPIDKATFNDYLEQKGVDLSKDLLELQVAEQSLPAMLGAVSGILVDEQCRTNVPGLYSAGGCCTAPCNLSAGLTAGIRAGLSAAEEAATMAQGPRPVAEARIQALKERIYEPAGRSSGYSAAEVEIKLEQIMSDYVGIGRNDRSLRSAMADLGKLSALVPRMTAGTWHELMRAHEVRQLVDVSRLITIGALTRTESRFGLSHFRGDYPKTDPEWQRSVLLTKQGDEPVVSFKPAER